MFAAYENGRHRRRRRRIVSIQGYCSIIIYFSLSVTIAGGSGPRVTEYKVNKDFDSVRGEIKKVH